MTSANGRYCSLIQFRVWVSSFPTISLPVAHCSLRGRVLGKISYGRIEIARGGIISGQIDVLPETAIPDAAPAPEVETAEPPAAPRTAADFSIPEPVGGRAGQRA